MIQGTARFSDTLKFVRDPEAFIASSTKKWGPTWFFHLAGRKVLVTSDASVALPLMGSEGTFFPDPLFHVFGRESILFQSGDMHHRIRALLRLSMSQLALASIAETEAQRMCSEVLDPLMGNFRINLALGVRRYFLTATLEMLTGLPNHPGFGALWDRFIQTLRPTLLLPPHPWFRYRFFGCSPWDKCCSARAELRDALLRLARDSDPNYPAFHLLQELPPENVVDQLMTILFGSIDNPTITLAWMLSEQSPEASSISLFTSALENHPPMPFLPHHISQDHPDLGLKVGDGVAIAPKFLPRSAFGIGPHRCLGAQWAQILVQAAFRVLRPYLVNHRITLGPSKRQNFSWGPSEIWLQS